MWFVCVQARARVCVCAPEQERQSIMPPSAPQSPASSTLKLNKIQPICHRFNTALGSPRYNKILRVLIPHQPDGSQLCTRVWGVRVCTQRVQVLTALFHLEARGPGTQLFRKSSATRCKPSMKLYCLWVQLKAVYTFHQVVLEI